MNWDFRRYQIWESMAKQLILTITGPTCSGKTTLQSLLTEKQGFTRTIGFTTRAPRDGEVHNIHYRFTTKEEITSTPPDRIVEQIEFNGNLYGVTLDEIEKQKATGKPIVVILEPNGLKQYRVMFKHDPNYQMFSVFVSNPKITLVERFLTRFAMDVLHARSLVEDKVIKNYTSRLISLEEEHENWYNSTSYLYDWVVPTFNADNQETVIQEILQAIERDKNRSD